MKEFVVESLEKFLAISDHIDTPFKFVQVEETKSEKDTVVVELKASVWMRTAFLTYENVGNQETMNQIISELENHGFARARIREAPIVLR